MGAASSVPDEGMSDWIDLPCDNAEHWERVQGLRMSPPAVCAQDLSRRMAGYLEGAPDLNGLVAALADMGLQEQFFESILPSIVERALDLPRLREQLPEGRLPVLRQKRRARLDIKRNLGASLLANMFLCTWKGVEGVNYDAMPSVSFLHLFRDIEGQEVAKLQMFIHYFERIGDQSVPGVISIERVVGTALSEEEWCQSQQPLLPLEVERPRVGFEAAPTLAHADFANMFIGGGVLSGGCVQEEIRFAICPELTLSMLVCPCMLDEEAIQILGTEQFSNYEGYAFSLRYGGDHCDESARGRDGSVKSAVLAMDALDLRSGNATIEGQLSSENMLRELNKALAAFTPVSEESLRDHPMLATGNWGCGVFCGSVPLKALLQWASASQCRRRIKYFPFDVPVGLELNEAAKEAVRSGATVGQLVRALCGIRKEATKGKVKEEDLLRKVAAMLVAADPRGPSHQGRRKK